MKKLICMLAIVCSASVALAGQIVLKGDWKDSFNFHEAQINADGDMAWVNAPYTEGSFIVVEASYEPNMVYDEKTETEKWDKTGTLMISFVSGYRYGTYTYFDEETGKKKSCKYAEPIEEMEIGETHQVGSVFVASIDGMAGLIKVSVKAVKVYYDPEDKTEFEYEYRVSISSVEVVSAGAFEEEILSGKGTYRPDSALTKLANDEEAEVTVMEKIEAILRKAKYLE